MEKTRIKEIEGILTTDSAVNQWGQLIFEVKINKTKAKNGDICSAKGIVSCSGKQHFLLVAGEHVTLTGYFSEERFKFTSCQVNAPLSKICLIRRSCIRYIDNVFRSSVKRNDR